MFSSHLNTDRIVSISAIVVALGTLIMIIYQSSLMRESQHASVLPYLHIGLSLNENGAHVFLQNRGVGPAVIESITVQTDNETADGDPLDYLAAHETAVTGEMIVSVDRLMPGIMLPAAHHMNMLSVKKHNLNQLQSTFLVNGMSQNELKPEAAIIHIVYSSVYGERWRASSNRIVPERLD